MKKRTFYPGETISFLANPESHESPKWVRAEIEDVLSTQVTLEHWPWYLQKSDYGTTWRIA